MPPYGDEDDSQPGFSDNENDQDENMEDGDDGDGDGDGDNAGDGTTVMDNDDENDDNDGDADDDGDENPDSFVGTPSRPRAQDGPSYSGQHTDGDNGGNGGGERSGGTPERSNATADDRTRDYKTPEAHAIPSSHTSPAVARAKPFFARVRPDMITAELYDIVPTIAAPHSTSINTLTATPDMRWVFSGGADGWIRKFNWIDTVNAKSMLTVAQRHPFVDSVTKAGVLMSYWENEEPSDEKESVNTPKPPDEALPLSPVYSLAVHPQALWLLSGTEVGAINLQSVRHEEGKRITSLYNHTSAVSVMTLLSDSQTLISGSWDKTILEWDLNVGRPKRTFNGSRGQISALEFRPNSATPIPRDTLEPPMLNGSSDALGSGREPNGVSAPDPVQPPDKPQDGADGNKSPGGSLFEDNADNASLFGENDAPSNGALAFEEDDDFSRAVAEGMKQQEALDADGDVSMPNSDPEPAAPASNTTAAAPSVPPENSTPPNVANGAPEEQDPHPPPAPETTDEEHGAKGPLGSSAVLLDQSQDQHQSTFMDAAHDGTLRVWDRRQPNPVARMTPSRSVPPWCMHACWSPDGNYIYAGRRNGTVDEYSVHKGLREPTRSLRFPGGSGAVSALRTMPNGKHLVCASYDILRLYDLKDEESFKHANVPFLIVPGHRTGVVSQLFLDPTCSFMISTGGNRGWEGASTEVLLGYEIGLGR